MNLHVGASGPATPETLSTFVQPAAEGATTEPETEDSADETGASILVTLHVEHPATVPKPEAFLGSFARPTAVKESLDSQTETEGVAEKAASANGSIVVGGSAALTGFTALQAFSTGQPVNTGVSVNKVPASSARSVNITQSSLSSLQPTESAAAEVGNLAAGTLSTKDAAATPIQETESEAVEILPVPSEDAPAGGLEQPIPATVDKVPSAQTEASSEKLTTESSSSVGTPAAQRQTQQTAHVERTDAPNILYAKNTGDAAARREPGRSRVAFSAKISKEQGTESLPVQQEPGAITDRSVKRLQSEGEFVQEENNTDGAGIEEPASGIEPVQSTGEKGASHFIRSDAAHGSPDGLARSIEPGRATGESTRTPAAPEAPMEPRAAEPARQPLKEFAVRVARAEEHVDLRLTERGGSLHVSVRTPAGELARSLQDGLPELVRRLDQGGFRSEVWTPGTSAPTAAEETSGDSTSSDNGGFSDAQHEGSSGERQGRGQERRQQRPDWTAEFEDRLERPFRAEPETTT
ncbi:MAG: hypothetical protein ACRD7E_31170 [Bryobacteraceae bacterium]